MTINDQTSTTLLVSWRTRFVCAAIVAVSCALAVVGFVTCDGGRTFFGKGPPLGNDFAGIYTAAARLNEPGGCALYDQASQDAYYHRLLPAVPDTEQLPYVYPPFVAGVLRPLAKLPYIGSVLAWLSLSAALYVAGFWLAWRCTVRTAGFSRTAFLGALAFEPFVMETWLGGQLSSVGFLLLAGAWYLYQERRPLAAGLCVGFCLYKPTLLLLLLPMLLIGRRWRVLGGVAVAGGLLLGLSAATAGWQNTTAYAAALRGFARTASGQGDLDLRLWKYIDLNSSLRLADPGDATLRHWLLAVICALVLAPLVRAWWRVPSNDGRPDPCLWGATLTLGLAINVYVGLYDSILVVLGLLLTSQAAWKQGGRSWQAFVCLVAVIFVLPWLTQPLARATGVQVYTPAILALAMYQIRLLRGHGRVRASPSQCTVWPTTPPREEASDVIVGTVFAHRPRGA